jgi:hypothetical protein
MKEGSGMWQCLLAAVILAAPASPKTDKPKKLTPYEKALKAATLAEIAAIDKQIASAEKRSKAPAKTRKAIRAKVLARKEAKKLKKRRLALKKGKVLPKLEIDPFDLKDGQMGTLSTGLDGWAVSYRVIECRIRRAIVVAETGQKVIIGTRTYGTRRLPIERTELVRSTPFVLIGVRGAVRKRIHPKGLWIVSLRDGFFWLSPISPPKKPSMSTDKE